MATETQLRSALDELGAFVATLRLEDLPREVVQIARRCVLDTIGCSLQGSTTEEGRKAVAAVRAMDRSDLAGVWGTPFRASAPLAAFANGTTAHARELDDVNHAILHPSAVLVPAILAVAEAEGRDGATVIAALVAGHEVMSRLSTALTPSAHRRRGFHGTATCGSIAAGAAAARVLGLGPGETTWAAGLGGTAAGGIMAFLADGSMAKRAHAGLAALHGVLGVYLAREGYSGPRYLLEAEDGFLRAFTDSPRPEELTKELGQRWDVLRTHVKPYPACKACHAPLEAIQALQAEEGLRAEDVEEIVVRTALTGKRNAGKEGMPETILAAQMSTAFTLAVALQHGSAGPEQYTPERLRDPAVRSLAEKVHVVVDPAQDELQRLHGTSPALTIVQTRDGRTLQHMVEYTAGSPEKPLTERFIAEKYTALARLALPADRVEAIRERVGRLDQLEDIHDLVDLLTTG